MTKQKKPKTGDVVGWLVLDRDGDIYDQADNRKDARHQVRLANESGYYEPYRLAKITLA